MEYQHPHPGLLKRDPTSIPGRPNQLEKPEIITCEFGLPFRQTSRVFRLQKILKRTFQSVKKQTITNGKSINRGAPLKRTTPRLKTLYDG